MALLAFWNTNREHVLGQTVQQILSNASDGKLRDGSECSREFRAFLREAPSEHLYQYVQYCLESAFSDSGLVLQDLVNEIGRRLEFEAEVVYTEEESRWWALMVFGEVKTHQTY